MFAAGYRKIALLVVVLAIAAGLYVGSLERFRSWMGERSMAREDYPAAILWFSRALRAADAEGNSADAARLSERLYQAYEGFCHWNFDGRRLWGWYAGNQINALKLQGDLLIVGCTGDDPYLEIHNLKLAPDRAYRFQTRFRHQAGQRLELYWAAGTDIFSPKNHATVALKTPGQWNEYQVDIPPSPQGLGKFRFSPTHAPGTVEIDWIRIDPAAQRSGMQH